MNLLWFVGGLLVGLVLGMGVLALAARRGWYSWGGVGRDAAQELGFLVQGLHVVTGKKSAPCPSCGFRFGQRGDGVPPPDVKRRRGVLNS